MSTKKKSKATKKKQLPASIVWFEIPADNMARAKTFYGKLFGWKIGPFHGMNEYWMVETKGGKGSLNGGMYTRKYPAQQIVNYVNVASVSRTSAKVKKLGGKISMEKTAVPGMGYFAVCQDTDGNTFGLWETNENAK